MIQLVGINGRKRSGKGEAANILSELIDGNVHQVGFADKLKQLLAMTLGFEGSPENLIALMDRAKLDFNDDGWGVSLECKQGVHRCLTMREAHQNLGVAARNLFGGDFWVDQILPSVRGMLPRHAAIDSQVQLRKVYPNADVVVVTDVRFENEAQRIRDLGGVMWEVIRDEAESDGHVSEQAIPGNLIDWRLYNNGTLEDLQEEVVDAIRGTLKL